MTAAEKEHLSRKRKEFNQEQKRKEKEKRQRIINREKKRAVKRIHLKRLAILFGQIAPQFVYTAESASATNKQQSHLLEDPIYNIIHQIKRTSDFLYSCVKDYPILLCITEKTELIKHGTRLRKEDEQNHMKVLWQKSCLERQRKASSDNNRKAM
jgi:hypothetical protein